MSATFEIPACAACGHAVWPPRLACSVCGAAEQWELVDASDGTLEEITELAGAEGQPVRLCSVKLDAGPIVVARVEHGGPAERVSMALRDGGALWATATAQP